MPLVYFSSQFFLRCVSFSSLLKKENITLATSQKEFFLCYFDEMLQIAISKPLFPCVWQMISLQGQNIWLAAWGRAGQYSMCVAWEMGVDGGTALKPEVPLTEFKHTRGDCRIVKILLRTTIKWSEERQSQFENCLSLFMPLLYLFFSFLKVTLSSSIAPLFVPPHSNFF